MTRFYVQVQNALAAERTNANRSAEEAATVARREAEQQAIKARHDADAADPLKHALRYMLDALRNTPQFQRRESGMMRAVEGAQRCINLL